MMSDIYANAVESAVRYKKEGLSPIPVPSGQKAPRMKGWQNFKTEPEDAHKYFEPGENVGLLMGTQTSDGSWPA